MKRSITYKQIILKTIEYEADDLQSLNEMIKDYEDNGEIDFDKNFDSMEVTKVFVSGIKE